MNVLVNYLKSRHYVGRPRAVTRSSAAAGLEVSVRDVRAMAEESRLAGDPEGVVCYSAKGLYLAEDASDIVAIRDRITRECKRRLLQRRGLKNALAKINQLMLPA